MTRHSHRWLSPSSGYYMTARDVTADRLQRTKTHKFLRATVASVYSLARYLAGGVVLNYKVAKFLGYWTLKIVGLVALTTIAIAVANKHGFWTVLIAVNLAFTGLAFIWV